MADKKTASPVSAHSADFAPCAGHASAPRPYGQGAALEARWEASLNSNRKILSTVLS